MINVCHAIIKAVFSFVYQKIVNRLKRANLIAYYSPHDVLTGFSGIYKCKVRQEAVNRIANPV
jgi:hypothetical protein